MTFFYFLTGGGHCISRSYVEIFQCDKNGKLIKVFFSGRKWGRAKLVFMSCESFDLKDISFLDVL